MAASRTFLLMKQDSLLLEPLSISGGRRLRSKASANVSKVKVSQEAPECARFADRTLIGQALAEVMFLSDFFPEQASGPLGKLPLSRLDASVFITDIERLDPSCVLMLSICSRNPDVQQLCQVNQRASAIARGNRTIHGPTILARWHGSLRKPTEMVHEYLPPTEESRKALTQHYPFLSFGPGTPTRLGLQPPTERRGHPPSSPSRAAAQAAPKLGAAVAVAPPPVGVPAPSLPLPHASQVVPPPGLELLEVEKEHATHVEMQESAPRLMTLERARSQGETGATDFEEQSPGAAPIQLQLERRIRGMARVVEEAKLLLFPQLLMELLDWIVENQAAEGLELLENLEELAACMKPMARARLGRALKAAYGGHLHSEVSNKKC